MINKPQFFINGEWLDKKNRPSLDLINPATEEVEGQLQLGNAADVDLAVIAAKNAFPGFSSTTIDTRVHFLQKIVKGYQERARDIGLTISREMGAPLAFAMRFQVGAGLSHFKEILRLLKTYNFNEDRNKTRVIREPIGVCGMIVPWNWPMNQISCKVAPALAAGCTMVLKPSEIAPGTAIILAEILEEAGIPKGVFNIVQGEGAVVGSAISKHPDIDMVSFTGSTKAGIAVSRDASATVKRVGLELGGKAANVLLDDVDLDDAVSRGVTLCFRNSGQSCNSPTRMLVPQKFMNDAAAIAKITADGMSVGDPVSDNTLIGPVVSERQWNSIQEHIGKGIKEGAILVTGGPGRPDDLPKGYYIRPTIFSNVTQNMTIAQEEIFGPVLSIMAYKDEDDAVNIANNTPYGLAAYVESKDQLRARSIAHRIRAGMVHLNGAGADPGAPFGGYRQSGNGREWGIYGLEEFTEIKAVMGYTVS